VLYLLDFHFFTYFSKIAKHCLRDAYHCLRIAMQKPRTVIFNILLHTYVLFSVDQIGFHLLHKPSFFFTHSIRVLINTV